MATYKEMLLSIVNKGIDPPLGMQYGGGLDDAYMDMSRRRSNAFADPDANTAFASPMSIGGLPTIYRQNAGPTDQDVSDFYDYYSDPVNTDVEGSIDSQGNFTGGENQSPSLKTLVDLDIIDYDEAYNPQGIQQAMLEAEERDRSELEGEYPNWYSARGAPTLDQRSVRSLSERDQAKVQDLISDDKMYGLGIPIANMLERQYDLNTFEKGLRSGLENYSQGSAKDREDPSYITDDDAPEDVKRLAIEFRNAKPGETMKDFSIRFEEETGRVAPLEYFGFDRNSARDMNKNVQDVNAAMQANNLRGIGQGLGLVTGLFTNPLTGMNTLTRGYTGEFDSEGRPVTSTALGSVYDRVKGGLSDLLSKDKEVSTQEFRNVEEAREFLERPSTTDTKNLRESEFKQREAIAREQLGREPTLEEVNKVDVSGSGITVTDVLRATDNPVGFALDKATSGRPTLSSDITREREAAAKEVPTETKEVPLAISKAPTVDDIKGKDSVIPFVTRGIELSKQNKLNSIKDMEANLLVITPNMSQAEKTGAMRHNKRINQIIDVYNREIKNLEKAPAAAQKAPEESSTNSVKEIVTSVMDAGGNLVSGVVEGISDFFGSILGGGGEAAIPDEPTGLGPNEPTGLRQLQKKPTNQQVAAIVTEVAKTPEKVQQTLLAKGLLYQYLALIQAGYKADEAMQAVGAEAGTPLGASAETVLV